MNQDKNNVLTEIRKIIENATNIALFCHIRPDGDAIGSMLGLAGCHKLTAKDLYTWALDNPPIDF